MGPGGAAARRARVTVRFQREIDTLFRRGARSTDELLTVFSADTLDPTVDSGRLAFIAGRRVGGAVARNRSKRVMREAVRRAGGPWRGMDVVMVARQGTGSASAERLDRSVGAHLRRLGVSGK